MPTFRIVGLDQNRSHTVVEISASSEADAHNECARRRITPVVCEKIADGSARSQRRSSRPLSAKQLYLFCERLHPLLEQGIPHRKALTFVANNSPDPAIRAICSELQTTDQSLTDAVSASTRFPPLVQGCMKVGSDSADLPAVLAVLSRFYCMRIDLIRSIRTSLTQPVIALVIILVFIFISILFVVPRVAGILTSLNYKPTGFLAMQMWISSVMRVYWPFTILLIAAGVILVIRDNPIRRTVFEYIAKRFLAVRLVVYGLRQTSLLYAMAVLFRAEVPHRQVLEYALGVVKGTPYEDQFRAAIADHERDTSFADALDNNVDLDPEIIFAIRTGVETTTTDEQLQRVAERFEKSTKQACDELTAIINPVVVIFCAALAVVSYLSTFGTLLWVCNKLMRSGA
jgi:type II secretory pathway component PulF